MVLAVPFSNPGGYGYTAQYPCDNKGTDRARHAVQKLCTVAALSQGAKQQLDVGLKELDPGNMSQPSTSRSEAAQASVATWVL